MTPVELLSLLQAEQHPEWETRRRFEERTYHEAKSILKIAQEKTIPQSILSAAIERIGLYDKNMEAAKEVNLPPLQSIADFIIFMKLKAMIDEGLPYCGDFKPNTKLLMGSLEVMNVNAWIAKVNDIEDYLVVLHSGLLSTLSIITNIISIIFEPESEKIDYEKIEVALPFFIKTFKKYVFYSEIEDFFLFPLKWHTKREENWLVMDSLCKMLVLAHEYSHVLLGHLDDPRRLASVQRVLGVGALNANKRDEVEADELSFQIVVFSQPNRGISDIKGFRHRVAGAWMCVLIFFETLHLFERAKTMAGLPVGSTSHPEPRERIDNILSFIRTKEPSYSFLSYLLTLEGILRNCFSMLWMKAEKELSLYVDENTSKIQAIYGRMSDIIK